jgi:hypothetical protein
MRLVVTLKPSTVGNSSYKVAVGGGYRWPPSEQDPYAHNYLATIV